MSNENNSADDNNRNDDELRRMLKDEVPQPGASYWDSIDARLADVADERANKPGSAAGLETISESSDTDDGVVRLMDMTTPAAPTPTRSPILLAAAAVIAAIVGVGAFVALQDPETVEIGDEGTTTTPTTAPADTNPPPADVEATYRCFGPEFRAPEASQDFWIIQFKGEDFVSLEELPDFEEVSSVITTGTLGAGGSAEVASVVVPSGRRSTQTWFFTDNSVETSTETFGVELECAGLDNFDDLVGQLETEHAEILGRDQALNVVDGDPRRIATVGAGIDLEQWPLTTLPGPDGVVTGNIGDDLNNVRSTGRTATVDGEGYTEIEIPMGSVGLTGWISDDLLRPETRTLADIAETQSGSGFGIIDEVVEPGEDGVYRLIIEGVAFGLSPDATIVEGGITTPGPLGENLDFSNLQSGTTIEFIVNPELEDIAAITDFRVVGISAG